MNRIIRIRAIGELVLELQVGRLVAGIHYGLTDRDLEPVNGSIRSVAVGKIRFWAQWLRPSVWRSMKRLRVLPKPAKAGGGRNISKNREAASVAGFDGTKPRLHVWESSESD